MRYDHAVRWLRKCFAKLLDRARKQWGPQQYFMIPEPHESGWPHLHVLLRGSYIARLWVKRNWADITGSPNIDIKAIAHARNTLRDLAKYLTKSAPILAAFPTHLRPYTKSWGWLPDDFEKPGSADETWTFLCLVRGGPLFQLQTWQRLGADVAWDEERAYCLAIHPRGPPPLDVADELLTYGDSGARTIAAAAQSLFPAAGAPPASVDDLRDQIAWLTDDRRPF
jgi:hypothetical protein